MIIINFFNTPPEDLSRINSQIRMLSESSSDMASTAKQGYECPRCKNSYSTAYSMYRHMRKVHNCDINRCVTLYCPIENCNESYDRYNALDTHLTHGHYIDIRKETLEFSDLSDFEGWLRDISSCSKTKYIKRSCNNSYRYYRCHRSGLPKTSTEKLNTMKSSVKIGRHCPSRIIAKITDHNVQVEFVPTHIGHEPEIAKIPLSHKKRQDIACRLTKDNSSGSSLLHYKLVPHDKDDLNDAQQPNLQPLVQDQSQSEPSPQSSVHNQQRQSHNRPSPTSNQHLPNSRGGDTLNSIHNDQQTAAEIIHSNDSAIMMTPEESKNDHHLSLTSEQSNVDIVQQAKNKPTTTNNDNDNLAMMSETPNQQELTSRFERLLGSIKSDKHALIIKAQLEVCFALIRD